MCKQDSALTSFKLPITKGAVEFRELNLVGIAIEICCIYLSSLASVWRESLCVA